MPAASRKKSTGAPKKKPAAAAPKKAAPKKETKPKVKKTVAGKVTKAKKAVNGAAKKVEKKEVCIALSHDLLVLTASARTRRLRWMAMVTPRMAHH